MGLRVVAFTDTYLPTVNGVTYTVQSWRDGWNGAADRTAADGGGAVAPASETDAAAESVPATAATARGWMDVVYPASDHEPRPGEFPVGSAGFPFYEGFRVALPRVPSGLPAEPDVVHAHTPFSLGIGAKRLARAADVGHLVFFHHDPERTDEALDEMQRRAQERLADDGIECTAAYEGLCL